jgi:hypothetical protein
MNRGMDIAGLDFDPKSSFPLAFVIWILFGIMIPNPMLTIDSSPMFKNSLLHDLSLHVFEIH